MSLLYRIGLAIPENQSELLSAFLFQRTSHGWEEELLPNGIIKAKVHVHQEDIAHNIVKEFMNLFPEGKYELDKVEEENWAEAWKEFFTPVQGGKHFYVLAPWMEEEVAKTKLIPILIEPKTAFGTGHHGSTALCLDMISKLYEEGKINSSTKFLDLGTGSGILGISCAKLGLSGQGLDNDPIAISNALGNRKINAIPETTFHLACGCEDDAKGPYQLILANILPEPLINMAEKLVSLLDKEANLVLSGILINQADMVEKAYRAQGLPAATKIESGEWAALAFERKTQK